ncbi:hypothetical protein [Thermogemmatispora sp.]|uniref:hypothetical protein n=1 Tax=Thermogemmatispora sp. TaxID=1968838 RepID=UPI0035E42927
MGFALGKLWQARDGSSPGLLVAGADVRPLLWLLGLAAQSLRRWRKHAAPDERLPAEQWRLLLEAPLLGRLRRGRRFQPRREGLNEGRGEEARKGSGPCSGSARLGSARGPVLTGTGRRGGPGWAAARRGDP